MGASATALMPPTRAFNVAVAPMANACLDFRREAKFLCQWSKKHQVGGWADRVTRRSYLAVYVQVSGLGRL